MILVNTDYISGKNLEMLGLVKGSTIQSKNVGKDITQEVKTFVDEGISQSGWCHFLLPCIIKPLGEMQCNQN